MADKEQSQTQSKPTTQDAQGGAVQDLPPNHPEDRTQTTLTQNQEPDPDAQAEAIAKRVGEGAQARERGRRR